MELHFPFKNKVPMTMSNPVITFPFLNNPLFAFPKKTRFFSSAYLFSHDGHII